MSVYIPNRAELERARVVLGEETAYAMKHVELSKIGFQGVCGVEHFRAGNMIGSEVGVNTFTNEGLARLLNIVFHDIAKSASHMLYVFLFKNNITPAVADTAAKLGSGNAYGECQDADYDSPLTNRPQYITEDTTNTIITNVASKAHFVMNAAITIHGAGLTDRAAKTDVTGILMCAKRFNVSRQVLVDDEIFCTYQINCTTS